jgi:hypothetical protein
MSDNLSGNIWAKMRYDELVNNRTNYQKLSCVKDFCQCDCSDCIERRKDMEAFNLEVYGT